MKNEKMGKDHSYVVYEIIKCHDAIRNTDPIPGCKGNDCEVDPQCAKEPGAIDDWIKKKRLVFKVING